MPQIFNNLTGQRFGRWTVLAQKKQSPRNKISRWHCRCDCGNENPGVFYTALIRGQSKSCGHCSQPSVPGSNRVDHTGKKFGRWTVLHYDEDRRFRWICRCSCGTEKSVRTGQLVNGTSISCGCYRGEKLAAQLSLPPAPAPHMENSLSNSLYPIWLGMKTRCFNQKHPAYQRYGAKGVSMDPTWAKDFRAFAEHIGPRPSKDHSIDRIDPAQGYFPGNIRWATKVTQAENRNNNPWVIYQGETLRLRQLAEKLSLDKSLLMYQHVILQKPIEQAIETTLNMMDGFVPVQATPMRGFTSFIDYTGQQRGPWTVLCYVGKMHQYAPTKWLCRSTNGKVKVLNAMQLKLFPLEEQAQADWI